MVDFFLVFLRGIVYRGLGGGCVKKFFLGFFFENLVVLLTGTRGGVLFRSLQETSEREGTNSVSGSNRQVGRRNRGHWR